APDPRPDGASLGQERASPGEEALLPPEVHRPDRLAVAVEATGHVSGAGHLEAAVEDDRAVRRRVDPRLERGPHPGAAAVHLDDLAEHVELVARVDVRRVAEVAVP